MQQDMEVGRESLINRLSARAPSYLRFIRDKPTWLLMFVFGRTLAVRRIDRRIRAHYAAPVPVAGPSAFSDIDLAACVRALIKDGLAFGLNLPAPVVDEINAFARTHPCYSRDRQDRGFLPAEVAEVNAERDRDVIAAYYFETVEQCPAIMALRSDPTLMAIATAYLGKAGLQSRVRMWWSFPAKRVSDAALVDAAQEKFHFDMNGWRTLKFFFYLTPVTKMDGPHLGILGSHRRRTWRQQFSLTVGRPTEELERFYGKDRFVTITGEAGTGFAEDPFIFHAGTLCRDRPRLILELEFDQSATAKDHYGRPL
jgi:hypothetical protein